MNKSTLFLVTLICASAALVHAEERIKCEMPPSQAASAPLPDASLLLVQALPGMRPTTANPVRLLPGMAGSMCSTGLPHSLISDLTNAPNPFDSRKGGFEGQTQISYQLAKDAKVTIEIYSLLGRKVRDWTFAAGVNGGRQGLNTLNWDGTNAEGQKVAKGGYLAEIVIETPETTVTAIRKIGVIH